VHELLRAHFDLETVHLEIVRLEFASVVLLLGAMGQTRLKGLQDVVVVVPAVAVTRRRQEILREMEGEHIDRLSVGSKNVMDTGIVLTAGQQGGLEGVGVLAAEHLGTNDE